MPDKLVEGIVEKMYGETPLQAGDTDRKLREKVKEFLEAYDDMLLDMNTWTDLTERSNRYHGAVKELRKLVT